MNSITSCLWHYKWQRFLANLKFIVIDEAHVYRGVFGSNVALLIRRLQRLCAYYGSEPQFVISTATLANPIEFGEKLTGRGFTLIADDGSPENASISVWTTCTLTASGNGPPIRKPKTCSSSLCGTSCRLCVSPRRERWHNSSPFGQKMRLRNRHRCSPTGLQPIGPATCHRHGAGSNSA